MKIQIKGNKGDFTLMLPARLIFSKWLLRFVLKNIRFNSVSVNIPAQAIDKMLDEMKRIKKKHEFWELAEIDSANGQQIKIIL